MGLDVVELEVIDLSDPGRSYPGAITDWRSFEERYATRDAYLERARESATRLVAERHMLAEDVDAAVERAGRLWDFIARA
jgi:hypothetical protein